MAKTLSKRAKVTSDKPAYKEKIKTDKGYVWKYDEKHVEKRWKEKKDKLKKLEKELKKVRKQYKEDLSSDDNRTRAIAAIVGIMDETAMRIGNEDSAKEGTYGASTLKVKHIKDSSNKMTFDFPGKGAIEQNVELNDKKIMKVVRDLMKGKNKDDFVFEVDGKKIWDRAVNRYLKPFDISAKDLRGFHANRLMKEMLKKKDFTEALKEVSEIVGHEVSTLKNQYLDPELVAKHDKKESRGSLQVTGQKLLSVRAALKPEHLEWVRSLKQRLLSVREQPRQRQLRDKETKIAPHVKTNKLIEDAWNTLSPFLPSGAIMTSGERSLEYQVRIIERAWGKYKDDPRIPYHLRNVVDPSKRARVLTKYVGYIVGRPEIPKGRPSHLKGTSFDVSGADLNQIARAVKLVTQDENIPVKLTATVEPKNNAVHVNIYEARYDSNAVEQAKRRYLGSVYAEPEYYDQVVIAPYLYEDMISSGVNDDVVEEFAQTFGIDTVDENMGFGFPDDMGDWFEKSPMFRYKYDEEKSEHDIHDISDSEASQLAKNDPDAFFYRGLHKDHPEEEATALKNMLEDNAKFYFVFKYHERDEDEFKELLEDAAEALSQQDARAFFYYHLHHKFPELGRGAIVQIIDTNPDSFFDLGLDKDYPDYIESANNARNIKDPNKVELEMPEWAEDMVEKKSLSVRDELTKLSKKDESDRKKGAGVFIVLPKELSKQFPSLGDHDDSATHVTVLYIGEVPEDKQETVYGVVRDVIREYSPLKLQLDDKPTYFPATKHSDGCKVAKMAVVSKELHNLNKDLKKALTEAGIEIDNHFPTYKPHVTLEYMEPPKERYDGDVPTGSWIAKHVQVWSCGNKKRIPFGKLKTSALSVRAESLGPIAPMKLRKVETADAILKDYDDSDIIIQQKIDGFKTQAIKDKVGAVKLYTRRGEGFEANVPSLVKELEDKMDNGDFWLGELAYLKDGKQSISDVQTIVGSNPEKAQEKVKGSKGQLVFYVYDLLWNKGNNITKKPYIERYNQLKSKVGKSKLVQMVENYLYSDKDKAINDALKTGGEGIVLKPKNSKYRYAPKGSNEPVGEWAKYKPAGKKANTDEVILKEYSKGKEKLIFPMYQYKDSKLFEVGQLSGMSKEDEAKIKKDIDSGKQVVVEITFQERMGSGKFRHAGWSRFRPDKPAKEVKFSKASSIFGLSKRAAMMTSSWVNRKSGQSLDAEFMEHLEFVQKNPGLFDLNEEETEDVTSLAVTQKIFSDWMRAFGFGPELSVDVMELKNSDIYALQDFMMSKNLRPEHIIINNCPREFSNCKTIEISYNDLMTAGNIRDLARFGAKVSFLSKRAKEESGSKYEEEKSDPKWNQVLIDEDRKWTRKEIRDHYLKNADKILEEIRGEPVMLYVNTGKTNQNVLKRKHDDKPIKLNNKDDVEYWADRRLLSIHRVFGPETNLGFVDLDVHEGFSKDKTLKYAREIASKIKSEYGSKPTIYDSGGTGYHVEFNLSKPMKTDTLRNELRELAEDLNEKHPGFTTGIVKGKGVRTDTTTLKNNGNIRVPYALHEKYGGVKKPVGGSNAHANFGFELSKRAKKEVNKLSKEKAVYRMVEGSLYACNECKHWIPGANYGIWNTHPNQKSKPEGEWPEGLCMLHDKDDEISANGTCKFWEKGEPIPNREPDKWGRTTKKASWYRENEYFTGFKCNRCRYYVKDNTCEIVEGDIKPEASCALWRVQYGEKIPLDASNDLVQISKRAKKWKDSLPGGLADKKKPEDFDQEQLEKGTKIELEHVNDKQLAKEIAMDHLVEDEKYYDKLEKVEKYSFKNRFLSKRAADISISIRSNLEQISKHSCVLISKRAQEHLEEYRVMAEQEPERFFNEGWANEPELQSFVADAAKHILEKNIYTYLRLGIHKYPQTKEVTHELAIRLLNEDPYAFLAYEMHRIFPNLLSDALKNLSKSKEISRIEQLPDMSKIIRMMDPFDYFKYGLHNVPGLIKYTRNKAYELLESERRPGRKRLNILLNWKLQLHPIFLNDDILLNIIKKTLYYVIDKFPHEYHNIEIPENLRSYAERWKKETLVEQKTYDQINPNAPGRPQEAKERAKKIGISRFIHTVGGQAGEGEKLKLSTLIRYLQNVDNVLGEISTSEFETTKGLLSQKPLTIGALFEGKASHFFPHDVEADTGKHNLLMEGGKSKRLKQRERSYKEQALSKETEYNEAFFNPSMPGNRLVGYVVIGPSDHPNFGIYADAAKKLADSKGKEYIALSGSPHQPLRETWDAWEEIMAPMERRRQEIHREREVPLSALPESSPILQEVANFRIPLSKRAKDPLSTYKKKRDFDETPEPEGKAEEKNKHRFVIQRHKATKHHWDLRLESDDGVLESWAIPKAKAPNKDDKLLAVKTEDHPIEYMNFSGEIKEGYGKGTVKIVNKGKYKPIYWKKDKIAFEIPSGKANGKYVLVHTDSKNWLWMMYKNDNDEK